MEKIVVGQEHDSHRDPPHRFLSPEHGGFDQRVRLVLGLLAWHHGAALIAVAATKLGAMQVECCERGHGPR